jgi:hypothetical protein
MAQENIAGGGKRTGNGQRDVQQNSKERAQDPLFPVNFHLGSPAPGL